MQKNKLDYIITVFFLLICAKSTFIYYSDVAWFIFTVVTLAIGLIQKRIYENDIYIFLGFLGTYFLYILFRYVFLNKLSNDYLISDIFFVFKYILLAYAYVVVMKERIAEVFPQVIAFWSLITLGFYAFQLAGGGKVLFVFGTTIQGMLPPMPTLSETYSNFILFSYDTIHHVRNSGFAWEPGAFGCFLVIGMIIHFINNNYKFDSIAIIMTIAILSTLSTTTYVGFSIIMYLYYRMNGGKVHLGFILFLGIGLIAFFTLPFLGEKIISTYNEDVKMLDDYEELSWELDYYTEIGGEVMLNRFSSWIFLYRHFGWQLIFGVSNAYVNITSSIYGIPINRFNISNGIIDFITKFGLIGFCYVNFRIGKFIYMHTKSLEISFLTVVSIVLLNFGEPIFILPITMMFIFFPNLIILVDKDEEKDHDDYNATERESADELLGD